MLNLLTGLCLELAEQALVLSTEQDIATYCVKRYPGAPKDALISLEYLNKGAANIVYKILPWSDKSTGAAFLFVQISDGGKRIEPLRGDARLTCVLRVSRGDPKNVASEDIIHGFDNHILPLFKPGPLPVLGDYMGTQWPSSLPNKKVSRNALPLQDHTSHLMEHKGVMFFPGVIEELANIDSPGKPIVQGSPRWGILLPDMSAVPGASFTLEIKPKWLLQSPNAPPDAVRCRTCAMQIINPKNRGTYLCPLRLVKGEASDIRAWVNTIVSEQLTSEEASSFTDSKQTLLRSSIVDAILGYIAKGEGRALLNHLRFLQDNLDYHGVLLHHDKDLPQEATHRLRAAMTLRDCSWFINVPYDNEQGANASRIVSKLGDLDFKSELKVMDWYDKEKQLFGAYSLASEDDLECWYPRDRDGDACFGLLQVGAMNVAKE